jgi:hypothetical protein
MMRLREWFARPATATDCGVAFVAISLGTAVLIAVFGI